jgi:flagellar biosynthesis chaperone FliJ
MRQQQKNLETSRLEYEHRRARWSEKRIEAESLSKVVDRFRQEEQRATDRREQHDSDEAAARAAIATRRELTGAS